jgi:hypothetical protein
VSKTRPRWKNTPPPKMLVGQRSGSIEDPGIAGLLARICVAWPHFEEEMISVFQDLLGVQAGDFDTARLIFTALVNQRIRIDVMRELLERSRHNRDKGEKFDIVIDEYKKLNDLRNRYVHGRWWTHESGDTYLQSDNSVHFPYVEYRKVTKKELQFFLDRLNALRGKLLFD